MTSSSRRWAVFSGAIILATLAAGWVLFKRGLIESASSRRWAVVASAILIASFTAGWVLWNRGAFASSVSRKWGAVVGAILAAVLVAGSVTFFWPRAGAAPNYPYLRLSANASEYDRFDVEHPIALTLSIALPPQDPNRAAFPVVQLFAPGTIYVAKLTRDGVPIKPVTSGGAYFPGYRDLQEAGLYSLRYNEWVTIPFDIASVADGVWEITEVSPRGAYSEVIKTIPQKVIEHPDHEMKLFILDRPGLYALQLRYYYRGLDAGTPGEFGGIEHTSRGDELTFYGPALSNEITFRLR